jgi:hypothetical protein
MLTYGRVQSVLCIMHHLIPYIVKWTVSYSKSVTVPYEGQHNSEYARKEGRHLNKTSEWPPKSISDKRKWYKVG